MITTFQPNSTQPFSPELKAQYLKTLRKEREEYKDVKPKHPQGAATNRMQMAMILLGLCMEINTPGMKMSRISARDTAKRVLGYAPNQRPSNWQLLDAVLQMAIEYDQQKAAEAVQTQPELN